MKNAIYLLFDERYFHPAKQCIQSIKDNYPNHPTILASYDGNDKDHLNYLSGIENLVIIQPDYSFIDCKNIDLGPNNRLKVFYRYILWTDYFDTYDSIVHMDVDMLVLRPFGEVFESETFFCVNDYTPVPYGIFKEELDHNEIQRILTNLGIHKDYNELKMLNGGFFMLPRKFRTKEQFELILELTRTLGPKVQFADQSILSIWCHLNQIPITEEIQYNFQIPFLIKGEIFHRLRHNRFSSEDIKILHYTWWKSPELLKRIEELNELIFSAHQKYQPFQ